MELPAMCTHVPDASVPIRFRERSDLADKRAAGKQAAFLFCAHRAGATSMQIGIWRIPGHCEPVRFPGVAIPWLEVLLFVDEFRETAQKGQSV